MAHEGVPINSLDIARIIVNSITRRKTHPTHTGKMFQRVSVFPQDSSLYVQSCCRYTLKLVYMSLPYSGFRLFTLLNCSLFDNTTPKSHCGVRQARGLVQRQSTVPADLAKSGGSARSVSNFGVSIYATIHSPKTTTSN